MLKKLTKNQKGDTLVEVIIATAILSMVLAAAYGLSNQGARLNISSRERTQAVAYAQQQAEIITSYAVRDWDGFIQQIDASNTEFRGNRGNFRRNFAGNWQAYSGAFSPEPASAANYQVSYELATNPDCGGGVCANFTSIDVTQLWFKVNVSWNPITNGPVDSGTGQPIRQTTQLNVKVSPPGAEL